jgi:mono/diheme cytochrome c family protein
MPLRVRAAALVLAAAAAWATSSPASESAERGRALLQAHCGACHATGTTGSSAHPGAPAFRRIAARLDLELLADRMAEILVSSHPEMPSFRFSRADVSAIRVYLQSIQE